MATINDIVLIYFENQPTLFARIEDISVDVKPNWYLVKLLLLQLPLQAVTWILREPYIDGQPFTMNGKAVRLEKVEAPETEPEEPAPKPSPPASGGKVITLETRKKK